MQCGGAGIIVQLQAEMFVQTVDVKKKPAHVQVWKKVLPKSINNWVSKLWNCLNSIWRCIFPAEMCVQTVDVKKTLQVWKKVLPKSIDNWVSKPWNCLNSIWRCILSAEMCVETADVQKSVRFLHILNTAHVRVWKKVLPKSIDNWDSKP